MELYKQKSRSVRFLQILVIYFRTSGTYFSRDICSIVKKCCGKVVRKVLSKEEIHEKAQKQSFVLGFFQQKIKQKGHLVTTVLLLEVHFLQFLNVPPQCSIQFFVVPCSSLLFLVVRCSSLQFVVVRCSSIQFLLVHLIQFLLVPFSSFSSFQFLVVPCVPCGSLQFLVVPCSSLLLVVLYCFLLLLVVPRCSLLFLVVPRWSLLFLVVPCSFFVVLFLILTVEIFFVIKEDGAEFH